MARIRTVKPEFFQHYRLFMTEKESGLPLRVAFAGLWTQADREGRFKWEPPQLKLGCLPYDDVDFSCVLDALAAKGFLKKYVVGGSEYGLIVNLKKHQVINMREAQSTIPPPDDVNSTCAHVHAPAQTCGERKGKEGKGRERKGKDKRTSSHKFIKPSQQEIGDYFRERGCFDMAQPEKFWLFYESNGWRTGKNPMKDWKAGVRYWILKGKEYAKNQSTVAPRGDKQTPLERVRQQSREIITEAMERQDRNASSGPVGSHDSDFWSRLDEYRGLPETHRGDVAGAPGGAGGELYDMVQETEPPNR